MIVGYRGESRVTILAKNEDGVYEKEIFLSDLQEGDYIKMLYLPNNGVHFIPASIVKESGKVKTKVIADGNGFSYEICEGQTIISANYKYSQILPIIDEKLPDDLEENESLVNLQYIGGPSNQYKEFEEIISVYKDKGNFGLKKFNPISEEGFTSEDTFYNVKASINYALLIGMDKIVTCLHE